jgi:hypothetical protein
MVAGSVSKVEVSWDDALSGNFPESLAQRLFANTVIAVAAHAKAALPEANGRVDRARDLVFGGLVVRNHMVFHTRSHVWGGPMPRLDALRQPCPIWSRASKRWRRTSWKAGMP